MADFGEQGLAIGGLQQGFGVAGRAGDEVAGLVLAKERLDAGWVQRDAEACSLCQLEGGQCQAAIGQVGAAVDQVAVFADEVAVPFLSVAIRPTAPMVGVGRMPEPSVSL